MFDLTGRRVVATGASGDLGFAMAKALCQAGARVAILDLDPRTHQIAASLEGVGGGAFGVVVDLGDRKALDGAFHQAVEELGGLDVLLNCAGINRRASAQDLSEEDWDAVIEVNLSATFFLCQKAGELMRPQGRGKIINICSMTSFTGGMFNSAYVASKGGVAQLTKTLSNEWSKDGVCVNGIAPGYMRTKMNDYYFSTPEGESLRETITSRIPKGRWGKPEDLMGPVVFLASDASDFVAGHILPVDGGFLVR